MSVLAFDTATRATTVAVVDRSGNARCGRDDPEPGRRPTHTTRLLPLIDESVRGTGGWDTMATIAVGTGPGTFTGLRVGIATGLALARARALPVVGISTLASLALGADGAADGYEAVLAVLDARRGEVFAAAWRPGMLTAAVDAPDPRAASPRPALGALLAPAALRPEGLVQVAAGFGRCLAVGDGALAFRDVLQTAAITVAAPFSKYHRVQAAQHARLAQAGLGATGEAVTPQYLREPDAELTRRAAAR